MRNIYFMEQIKVLTREQSRMDIPDFCTSDTIKVFVRIKEGEKERLQVFQGVVIRRRNNSVGPTFTVRKVSYGVGVERIFPLNSPIIDHIDIINKGKVNRSRIYYIRKLRGKAARIKVKR